MKRIPVSLTDEQHSRLSSLSDQTGNSIAAHIREAIETYLDERTKPMNTEISRYRIIGPRGEGPFEVDATDGNAAIRSLIAARKLPKYGLANPRGPHGPTVAYEPAFANPGVMAKVGAFDITWLPPTAYAE